MDRPLVSVLLPLLNARQFLDVRIESLLAQTFSNWEAVVLDSHSTDGSWEAFRPVPHDCLLHFAGRSVYCSLTQLVVRMSSIKAVAPFETKIGSIADYEWLLRLTACAGSVHLPRKLAIWRYQGSQLSLRRDESRLGSMKAAGERTVRGICERQPRQLTRNDCAALLLPYKILWRVRRLTAFIAGVKPPVDSGGWFLSGLPPLGADFVERNLDSAISLLKRRKLTPAGAKIQGVGLARKRGSRLKKCLTNGK